MWVMMVTVVIVIAFLAYMAQGKPMFYSLSIQAGYAFIAVTDPGATFTGDITSGLSRLGGVLYGCLVAYVVSQIGNRYTHRQ
jgi:hypothetical protein